jgi:hypothetical protein
MRVFDKTCPACQTTFEAKRRNQLYCTPECRADINNNKLKAKFNHIKTLEKDKVMGDKYKAAYLSAIRIVEIEYDRQQKNEIITFEGRKFERLSPNPEPLREWGIYLGEKSIEGDKRIAVFIPQDGLLCFLSSYGYSANTITYRLMKKAS